MAESPKKEKREAAAAAASSPPKSEEKKPKAAAAAPAASSSKPKAEKKKEEKEGEEDADDGEAGQYWNVDGSSKRKRKTVEALTVDDFSEKKALDIKVGQCDDFVLRLVKGFSFTSHDNDNDQLWSCW